MACHECDGAEILARLEKLHQVVVSAFSAMVIVTPQGQPCYRTSNGLPQGMPKRIEQKVRVAMTALAADGVTPYWQHPVAEGDAP